MKRILITGENGYIGNAVIEYLEAYQRKDAEKTWRIRRISLRDDAWRQSSFAGYDTILHLAGIAHADIGRVSEETKAMYYRVNGDLAAQGAAKARAEGVKQFVYMSSVIVYGDSAPVGKQKQITASSAPDPSNFYGDSKYQAELKLEKMRTNTFQVAIIRSPMVYGKGSKGNFPTLVKLASRMPVFPSLENQRSMIYVENLAEFIRLLVEAGIGGVFFPQDEEYVSTVRMVELIGAIFGRKIRFWKFLNPFVKLASKLGGKIGALTDKAFGSLTIDQELSQRKIAGYRIYSLEEGVKRSVERDASHEGR